MSQEFQNGDPHRMAASGDAPEDPRHAAANAGVQRASAAPADTAPSASAPEPTFDDAVAAVIKHLKASRANTLALCACLSTCEERMPYRQAEALIDERPELDLSMQNAHALVQILVDCGGIEKTEVPEPDCAPGEEKPDMPVDYTVQTTEAGRAALAQFEPAKRFGEVLQADPAAYGAVYALVLTLCENGASKAAIEQALTGNGALSSPKQVYPSYFISKLETVGGLVWDGSWKTTEAGRQMLAMVG